MSGDARLSHKAAFAESTKFRRFRSEADID